MKIRNNIAVIGLVLLGIMSLSACGKKGAPTIPEGTEDHYPVLYPPVSDE